MMMTTTMMKAVMRGTRPSSLPWSSCAWDWGAPRAAGWAVRCGGGWRGKRTLGREAVSVLLEAASRRTEASVARVLRSGGVSAHSADRSGDGRTALHYAVMRRRGKMLNLLLDSGRFPRSPRPAAGVDRPDRRGVTALAQAARVGSVGSVDRLIARGGRPDAPDVQGVTPLAAALSRGHRAVALRLMEIPGLALDEVTLNGSTLLACAARGGDPAALAKLLERVPASRKTYLATDALGRTPEEVARRGGHRVAEAMLRRARLAWESERARRKYAISRVNARGTRLGYRPARTRLVAAVARGDAEAVAGLLPRGHPNSVDAEKVPLAVAAASAGYVAVLRTLMADHRFDVNLADSTGRTALHAAAQAGHLAVVEMLLAAGTGCDDSRLTLASRIQVDGETQVEPPRTAKDLALVAGHAHVVDFFEGRERARSEAAVNDTLLAGPADDVRLLLAESPQHRARAIDALHIAAREGDAANVAKLLAEIGVMDAEDFKMRGDLLVEAVTRRQANVVRAILDARGVDVNWTTGKRMTPLHLAAWHGDAVVVNLLLASPSCNPNAVNKRGHTPADVAEAKGHTSLVRVIRDAAAAAKRARAARRRRLAAA